MFVGADDGHEHQQYRQNDAVYKLRSEHDSHQVDVGNKNNHCRNDDDRRKDALEEGRFFPGERNACLPAECFADNKSGGKGQNACGQQTGGYQADGEQCFSVLARERFERSCSRFGAFYFDALREQHGASGYDDEPCHDTAHHGTSYCIDALIGKIAYAHALFDHVALGEEHHPGGDSGANHCDGKRKEAQIRTCCWHQGVLEGFVPIGLCQECRNDVGGKYA